MPTTLSSPPPPPAAFASLRSILLVELLGLEKLTNAFGLLLLFQGIAALLGSPVAGERSMGWERQCHFDIRNMHTAKYLGMYPIH